jgi:formylglycine-generating enzyme required for sulfatase activity
MAVLFAMLCSCIPGGRAAAGQDRADAASRPTTALAARRLPPGFRAAEGAGLHPSGWPVEIRCRKDGAVMVFVPAGTLRAGLDDEQVDKLTEMAARFDAPDPASSPMLWPGELLIAEDAEGWDEYDADAKAAVLAVAVLQALDVEIPADALARWRKGGRSSELLLRIPTAHDALRDILTEALPELAEDPAFLAAFLRWLQPQAGDLLTPQNLENLSEAPSDRRAAVAVLVLLQKQDAEIPAADLRTWRRQDRTLESLLATPAVGEALPAAVLAMGKELLSDPLMQRRREFRNAFPRPREVQMPAFYIDKHEVTNARYRRFFDKAGNPDRRPGLEEWPWYSILFYGWPGPEPYALWDDPKRNKKRQPVTCVDAEDVLAYAAWAGKQLPTRLQWMRAAVGDGRRLFPWGSDFQRDYCQSGIVPQLRADAHPGKLTLSGALATARAARRTLRAVRRAYVPARVGSHAHDRSPYGCMDMAGNVSEWVVMRSYKRAEPVLGAMGGNASCCSPEQHCPAMECAYVHTGRFLGFRTILLVEPGEESEEGQE